MKTSKIIIRNLFGIKEQALDGRSVEITGTNGLGKTSIIDAIRYALTNDSNRDYIVRKGETEGEILIETDTGISINRKKRTNKSDYKSIKDNERIVQSPESFISNLFTPLQLNPVEFTQMPRQEQNRIILDLIEFDWDLNWINEQFGEIPAGVDYTQNILKVLEDIQAENGPYFMKRQDINRDIRNRRAFISEISKDIPEGYDADMWEQYDLSEKYQELERIKEHNRRIEQAKNLRDNYQNKKRGIEAEREIKISQAKSELNDEKMLLASKIERLKTEIAAAEQSLGTLDNRLDDKIQVITADYLKTIAELDREVGVNSEYLEQSVADCTELTSEITLATEMKNHLNEYRRMKNLQSELETLIKKSDDLTSKIELARELPSYVLKTANLPIEGLTVQNGIPLINGLPISNLSEGEQLELCVDVAISKPNSLQIILIDGAEKLSDENRLALYAKCKEKGLQFVATRTTNDSELIITTL